MAITKLETKKFIDVNERGVTCQTQPPVYSGQSMPIYIPKLMPYIKKGSPVVQSVITKGSMVFVNDTACKPNVPHVVKYQNYISPKFENNASWAGIIDPDDDSPKVPSGTSVSVKFTSRNIQNPTFNPN